MDGGPSDRPRWSAPGTRDAAEIARVRAFRRARALSDYARAIDAAPEALCPICGYRGPFAPKRHKAGIWCPGCDSRPRHRLMALWLERSDALSRANDGGGGGGISGGGGGLSDGAARSVLHFAAEPWARAWFEARGAHYQSADIAPGFDLTLDITAMAMADGTVDLLIAHHVLEHVDDRAALAEIARVLRPGRRALLTVPMIEGWDATLEVGHLPPSERARLAGDPDHQRFYGRDLRTRIGDAGLALAEFAAAEPDVSAHALARGERLFVATRPVQTRPIHEGA